MAALKSCLQHFEKMSVFVEAFEQSMVLETNRMGQKLGSTYVGPNIGSSLFAFFTQVLIHQYPK